MNPSCDIIIVNWNGGEQLRRCVESIAALNNDNAQFRAVIVDNCSFDGSIDDIGDQTGPLTSMGARSACVTVIRNSENHGFGAACNQGAAGSRADYLLFLNPDTTVSAASLSVPLEFMERMENIRIGVCGIQLVDEAGRVARSCARLPTARHFAAKMFGLDRFWPKQFPGHIMEEWDHNESLEVDHVIGAFYLIRRSLFEGLGGFDERFFVYLEDLDLSLRVKRAGFGIQYLATARAFHKGGGTSDRVKARRLYYALRSRNLYGFKHFGRAAAILLMVGTLIIEPFARLALALAQRSPAAVRETLGGYSALWRDWPPWRTSRNTNAAHR